MITSFWETMLLGDADLRRRRVRAARVAAPQGGAARAALRALAGAVDRDRRRAVHGRAGRGGQGARAAGRLGVRAAAVDAGRTTRSSPRRSTAPPACRCAGDHAARLGRVVEVRVAHTAELDAATLGAARELLYEVFAGRSRGDRLGARAGRRARAGARRWRSRRARVGDPAAPDPRRPRAARGLRRGRGGPGVAPPVRASATLLMALDRGRSSRGAYDLGALGATDAAVPFYTARGWQRWRGPSWALTPSGVVRTAEEDGAIYVLPLESGAAAAAGRAAHGRLARRRRLVIRPPAWPAGPRRSRWHGHGPCRASSFSHATISMCLVMPVAATSSCHSETGRPYFLSIDGK